MKILHTADWHLGKSLEGYSRLGEQKQFLERFLEIVEEQDIDLILHAGDVYDTFNPPAAAEKLFYETMKVLSKQKERAIVIIAGNHDNPERLEAVLPLAKEHGIIIVGTPNSVVQPGTYGACTVINSGKGFIELEIRGERTVIITLPYPSEKRLGEVFQGEKEEDIHLSYTERLGSLFADLEKHYRDDTINLAMSHLYVVGGEMTDSERMIQLGGTYAVELKHLPLKAQYIALGHLHKTQTYQKSNTPIVYSGSPLQYSKKERNNKNSVYVLQAKAGEAIKVERIYLETYKHIEVWKCSNVEEAIKQCEEHQEDDSWVYLEIQTNRILTPDEIKKMKTLKKDIIEIRPILNDIQIEEEEIRDLNDVNLEEIFTNFYTTKTNTVPSQELVELFLELAHEEETV
ncbi:MAG: exonuclease SbcCD subunit D [Bacillaceae bacterium]